MNPGLIGGIAGSLIGVAGGVIGTYFSIKNTNSKAERMLMVKASVIFWTAGIAFVALLLILPPLYRWFLWIPYETDIDR
jgi:riboflavin transporter FmnP